MTQRLVDWMATAAMVAAVPILIFALAGGAAAARPNTSSVWISELDPGVRASLSLGTGFSVGYTTNEREPWALVRCYPNETTIFSGTHASGAVWEAVHSLWPGGPTPQNFVLGASVYPLWTGGGADCEVVLGAYSRKLQRFTTLATAHFSAAP